MRTRNVPQLLFLGLVTLLFGLPSVIVLLLLPGKRLKGRYFQCLAKAYSRTVLGAFGVKVAVRGLERIDSGRPYIFMSNHASHIDSPALALVIPQPLHWVFKKELSKIPVFGWVLLSGGQIMVDRADPEGAKAALREALAGLSGSSSVMIYPEGTRSRDGMLQPLKKGGFHMAVGSGLPIVPVRVSGSCDIVAAGTLAIRPGTVTIELFPPIPTEGRTAADIPELMSRVAEVLGGGTPDPG